VYIVEQEGWDVNSVYSGTRGVGCK